MNEPLSIEYDLQKDILTVNGVKYSGAVFRWLQNPRPDVLYRIWREPGSDTVTMQTIRFDEEEQFVDEHFFEAHPDLSVIDA